MTLPWITIINTQRATRKKPAAIAMEMHRYGVSLPSIRPHGESGLTCNCSSVPRSRSRTMDMAVANTVAICNAMPMTPGTKKFGLRIAGL